MFSCEFCEIAKNTFSYRTPVAASEDYELFGMKQSLTGILQILQNSQENTRAIVSFFNKVAGNSSLGNYQRILGNFKNTYLIEYFW